jgi:hypothetical protein
MTADDIYDAGDTRLLYGIRLENTANFRVLHNTISRYGRDGIKTMLSNNDGQTETDTEVGFIAYNYLYGMTVQDAIDVFNNGVRIVIHGNIAENCAKMMNVKTETTQNYLNIHHNIISSNIFKGSKYFNPDYAAFQYALHLKSSNTIVSNNLFYNMIGAGMIVDDCENVNITSNTVYDLDANTEDLSGIGIYVSSSVKNANFTCNNIKDCAKYGYDIDNYGFTMSGCCLTSTGDRGININPSSSLKAELRKGFTISGIKIVDLVGTMTKGISCGATCLGDAVVTGCLVGIEIPTKFQNDSDFVRDLGNSWNPRTSYQTAIPTTGTWTLGDLVYNSAPASSEDSGWTCTQSGTLGTLVGVTGSVTINEDVLTVNTVAGLTYGMYIDIVGVTGTKQIISIDETNLTLILSSVSDATVATAAVSYSAPVFKSVGTIA